MGVAGKKEGGCCWGTLVMKRVWCSECVCVCVCVCVCGQEKQGMDLDGVYFK